MTRHQSVRVLLKELNKVNRHIDHKIIEGKSYRKEARMHRELLKSLRRNKKENPLIKLATGFSMFL